MGAVDILSLPFFLSPIQVLGLAVLLSALFYLGVVQRPEFPHKSPVKVPGDWPVVGSLGFWTHRHAWWLRAQSLTSTHNFSFHVGKHRLVGTNSDQGRKPFFENSRELDFAEGYAVLFGQGPSFGEDGADAGIVKTLGSDRQGNNEKQDHSFTNHFSKRIVHLLKRDQFVKTLPTLISDVRSRLEELAQRPDKVMDPFDDIYKIVYLLTVRAVGATEIAEDRQLLDTTLSLFESIEKTATPGSIMFPWFPTPAKLRRLYSGGRMYVIFQNIVNQRAKGGQRKDDALQYLVDQGDDMRKIIAFIVGALFAGQLNSGINAAWVLCYLAASARWKAEIRKEVETAANKYHPGPGSLLEKVASLPLEAWENEFPMTDLCLRDSIRLQLHGTGFRKNVSGKDVVIDGEVIPPNGFLVYHFGEHHLNPSIYADPYVWDPSRYLPDRAEGKNVPYGFLGWGAGRHPCLGMRFAKLEQNIITALFVAMFEFELLDDAGNVTEEPPVVNHNNWQASAPDKKVRLRYSLREGVMG